MKTKKEITPVVENRPKFRYKDFDKWFKEETTAYDRSTGDYHCIDRVYRERDGKEVLLMTNEWGLQCGMLDSNGLKGVLILYEHWLQANDKIIVNTWKSRSLAFDKNNNVIKYGGADCGGWFYLEIEENK